MGIGIVVRLGVRRRTVVKRRVGMMFLSTMMMGILLSGCGREEVKGLTVLVSRTWSLEHSGE
jgi:hypothetical protein